MILQTLRTSKLEVEIKELTIGQAIDLCELPPELHEEGTSKAISFITGNAVNPKAITAQERAMIISHYISQTGESPDFEIGDAHLSNYLSFAAYTKEPIDLVSHSGNDWVMYPLTGIHTESIERIILAGRMPAKRYSWWLCAMAAMLFSSEKPHIDFYSMSDFDIDEYIYNAAMIFRDYPETEFNELLIHFINGVSRTDHLFRLEFNDYGISFKALEQGDSAVSLPPARFLFSSIVDEFTSETFGNVEK